MTSPFEDGVEPLRRRSASGPLRIGVLVSATGANLQTLIQLSRREPDEFMVCLVASHGRAPALAVAERAAIEAWPGDFDERCGTASACAGDPAAQDRYREAALAWHDGLDARIRSWETTHGDLDLIVLAYHRWIEGRLLERYRGRMLNQHPGDLSVLDESGARPLVGSDSVRLAMAAGRPATRTSCFLVDGTRDGGAVLAMGPQVPVIHREPTVENAREQELRQKRLSDPYCLEWSVRAFASGRLALAPDRHRDGSRVVLVDGNRTALGGWPIEGPA